MKNSLSKVQPPIRAVYMGLFPTMGSLQEVIELSESQLPITKKNQLVSLLMIYQNTLLKQLEEK